MTHFLRLLTEQNKENALVTACQSVRKGHSDSSHFELTAESFDAVPGKPFAYWVSDAVRNVFTEQSSLEAGERTARQGLATAEDFRFVRAWWESQSLGWFGFAKGGAFSPFYADVYLLVNWNNDGSEIKAGICRRYPYLNGNSEFVAKNTQFYFRAGLTWSLRSQIGIGVRAKPAGCIFGHKGPSAFVDGDSPDDLLALLALLNSKAFALLVSLQVSFGSYEVGVLQRTPVPTLNASVRQTLASLSRQAWSLKRIPDTTEETTHAFVLPSALRVRLSDIDLNSIEADLTRIQSEIDDIAFDLYGFNEADRIAVQGNQDVANEGDPEASADDESDQSDDEDSAMPVDQTAGLLSWAVGVAFGRFDWRLATGERTAPAEPEPFEPLPAKSPGMLPDDAEPFHAHAGILVDDQGHPHDLARLVEEVLNRVDVSVPDDVRRWLRKDFYAFHLQRYSKSRRKAPIYWPLATASGSYTLWIYYPSLNNQTLFTAVNDFLDGPNGKLTQVSRECVELRIKGSGRSRDEEKQYDMLQTFEQELIDLRDTLLKIAPSYQPNHDDGVQITAAPLWPLFRHKPWQKILRDTWTKLEKGDYDWAYLAMAYWPERVREKCKTDKSLAIAHGLEDLYVQPEAAPKKTRGRKKEQ